MVSEYFRDERPRVGDVSVEVLNSSERSGKSA